MAGLGFKDFAVGEVLTSSDVDGYLMQQTVMRFADSAARGSALGTATGTAVALAEGMVTYLDDADAPQFYDGAKWLGMSHYNASVTITASDATWAVPALASPIVRVIVVGGGGGGGGSGTSATAGGTGGTSSFAVSGGSTISAVGGGGGARADTGGVNSGARAGQAGLASGNQGNSGVHNTTITGGSGAGGKVEIGYVDLSGVSTVNVTVGAGGTGGGTSGDVNGGAGGRGEVIVEYMAA